MVANPARCIGVGWRGVAHEEEGGERYRRHLLRRIMDTLIVFGIIYCFLLGLMFVIYWVVQLIKKSMNKIIDAMFNVMIDSSLQEEEKQERGFNKMVMIALVANMPYPYRSIVYDIMGEDFMAIYSCKCEPNRVWSQEPKHKHVYLKPCYIPYGDQYYLHINLDIFRALNRINPDVVILFGFSPTQQLACLWCRIKKIPYVMMSDSFKLYEEYTHRSKRQEFIQGKMIHNAGAMVVIGQRGKAYYSSLGYPKDKIFISHLAIEPMPQTTEERTYDLIYACRFVKGKCPMFIVELMKRLPNRNIIIAGDGEYREELLNGLSDNNIEYSYVGTQSFENMQKWFSRAKITLMPTEIELWGYTANEAMAQGTPVITTGNAACAGELVIHTYNGFILPLNADMWADYINRLLDRKSLWRALSDNSLEYIKNYHPKYSAQAILDACKKAME